jgi:molybdopterin molybdotransferase
MASRLIEIDEARRIVLDCTRTLESERVELQHALGRVLAGDVESRDPVPPFDSSAMDGFALRCVDVRGAGPRSPVTLSIVDESRAGHPSLRSIADGEAVAISTGAPIPAGADAVVAVEQTSARDGHVEVLTEVPAGNDVRLAGEDVRAGRTVLTRGTPVGPSQLGVLASLGRAEVSCVARPRVSVITTGDELVEPGLPLAPGSIYNSNAYSVPALARRAGAQLGLVATVADDPRATREAIAAALADAAVVVLCGGVSVGVHDHVRPVLAELGVSERFWGVALKPGKPTWLGVQDQTLVFGLPGNPVSAMVTFTLFVRPALRALGGASTAPRRTTATLRTDYTKEQGRAHAVRCRLALSESGWDAEPTGDQSSHVLSSMLNADALAIIPTESSSVRAGERVEIELLEEGWPS